MGFLLMTHDREPKAKTLIYLMLREDEATSKN